jgi:hypothetical protein
MLDGIKNEEEFVSTLQKMQNRMADIYRFNWNLHHTAQTLANASHLMMWSDNDILNDFTIATGDDMPLMIHIGHTVFRRNQRQLWDPNYEKVTNSYEHFCQKIGPVGVIMIDMRGNRIDWEGKQHPDNDFINDDQWTMIKSCFSDPEIAVMLVCAEIPFVGHDPSTVRGIIEAQPDQALLKDHWSYHGAELSKLLEQVFDWKEAGKSQGKEAVLIGGDIHVGVTTIITDHKTGLTCQQLTATPITNNVTKFYPPLTGKVDSRFSFEHKPLIMRNFALVDMTFPDHGKPVVTSNLVPDPHPENMKKK